MTFNSGFAADSGVENFWNNSVDFGKLSSAAAVQRAMKELNAIKRESGTFNAIMGADAKAEMEKYYGEGRQAMGDANIFNSYLNTGAQLVGGGISAFGNAGGFFNNNNDPGTFGTSYGVGQTDYSFDADPGQYAPGSISSPGWTWDNSGIG